MHSGLRQRCVFIFLIYCWPAVTIVKEARLYQFVVRKWKKDVVSGPAIEFVCVVVFLTKSRTTYSRELFFYLEWGFMHRLRCKYLFIFLLSKSVIWSIWRPQEKKNIASVKRLSESAFLRRSAIFCPKNRLGWTLYTRTAVWKIVRWLWRRGERRPRQWRASQIYGVAAFSTHVFPLIQS